MVLTLEDLCHFFQDIGSEEVKITDTRKRKQHVLVAGYLLQNLEEGYERLVLAAFLKAATGESKTEADVKNVDLLLYTSRKNRNTDWIRIALEKLERLGWIVRIPRHDSRAEAFALAPDASCLKQWWADEEWRKDDVLGIKEWLAPTGLLVSP